MNTAGICGSLDAIARRVVHQIDQKLVDTQQLLPGIRHRTIVFVKFVRTSLRIPLGGDARSFLRSKGTLIIYTLKQIIVVLFYAHFRFCDVKC